jgi:hypothetical protein
MFTFSINGTIPIYKKIKIIKLCNKLNIDCKNNKVLNKSLPFIQDLNILEEKLVNKFLTKYTESELKKIDDESYLEAEKEWGELIQMTEMKENIMYIKKNYEPIMKQQHEKMIKAEEKLQKLIMMAELRTVKTMKSIHNKTKKRNK